MVLGAELLSVVERWVRVESIEHPWDTYGQAWVGAVRDVITPLQWLAAEAGYTLRSLHRITHQEYVGLRAADRILTAIGWQHMLVNGEIHVVPNPSWSQEGWMRWMKERGC